MNWPSQGVDTQLCPEVRQKMKNQLQNSQSKNRFIEHLIKLRSDECQPPHDRSANSTQHNHWLSKLTNLS